MTERPNKRQRSESYGDGGRQAGRSPINNAPAQAPPKPPVVPSRTRRVASGSTVKVTRDESHSPDESKKALKLTMKMPSSKLREATSNSKSRPSSRGNAAAKLTDSLTGGETVSGPRASRGNKKYVVESESSEEESQEDEDDEVQASDEDHEEEDELEQIGGPEESEDDDAAEEEEEEDAEGELDADGDVDMDDGTNHSRPVPSPHPILKVNGPAATPKPKPASKPTVTVTPAQADKIQSVEAKEMEMDDDDEELSDLSEDDEDAGEDDAEGDIDEDIEDDDDSRSPGSRGSTPDITKMTKRQRSRLDQVMGGDFLQLPMEPQTKKHLTVEEHAMRRAEMARRRKNLSEKRNEEEKMDTINRLLKKQAPKRRGKISAAEITAQEHGDDSPPEQQEEEVPPADPLYTRWISDRDGFRVGVPQEWLGTPVGRPFEKAKMVEEVKG